MAVSKIKKSPHIYSIDVNIGGAAITSSENEWYYGIVPLSDILPSNASMVGAMWTFGFETGTFLVPTFNKRLGLMAPTSRTVPTGRLVTILYTLT